jgi:hypothetical protein
MAFGWRDNKGRFHPVGGARAGEFKPVETGFGTCIVKMIDENDPACKPKTYTLNCDIGDDGLMGKCDCGWIVSLPDFAYPNPAKALAEAQRRFSLHKLENH